MDDVTAGFGSYDLSEIAEEYRSQAEGSEKDVVLPKRVGGSRVHLLLRIKNTNLDPVLVKVLPSGIAVYLSPFKDIYGSRIIFAGPHKSFTRCDNGVKTEMSNAVFLVRDQIHERLDIESEMRCFFITKDKRLRITVNPYPINEEDVLDCNGEIPEQFEKSLDDHEKLLNLLEESNTLCSVHNAQSSVLKFEEMRKDGDMIITNNCENHDEDKQMNETTGGNHPVSERDENLQDTIESIYLRGVHKAHVPIAKFRNALDDEDEEELEEIDEVDDGSEEFAVLAANTGRGVAELLVDPTFQGWITDCMQGWRAKPSQREP